MFKLTVTILAAALALAASSPARTSSKVNFNLDEDFYNVPNNQGSMVLMSRQEIIDYIENSPTPRFNVPVDVKYILHTRTNPGGVRIYLDDDEGLWAAGWNPADPVRFTAHGWNGDVTSNVNAVKEFIEAGNFNHIVIDWSVGAGTINYIDARNRVPEVAKFTGEIIHWLVRLGSSYDNVYVIGHSLGGQMTGLVGQYMEGIDLAACIALDPAGPLFSADDINDRTSPDDCRYVEVIHTNGWMLGFGGAIGDSDFYPNGGKSQPGCGIDLVGTCAHGRAPEFFQESLITNEPFVAWHCTQDVDNVVAGRCETSGGTSQMMGTHVNYGARGLFYLTTSSASPFMLPLFAN